MNFYPFLFLSLFMLSVGPVISLEKRSFDEIFPDLPSDARDAVFSGEGYTKSDKNIRALTNRIDPQISDTLLQKNSGFLVETLMVLPDTDGKYTLIDVYNALGKIRGLKGRSFYSYTFKKDIVLFEETTRIESVNKNVPVDDPPPAAIIPESETIYMRLKDTNFGNSFFCGDITKLRQGLRYSLTNNRNLTFFLIPVIKEEKFITQLYFEPIMEGILIYAVVGADVSAFIASTIDVTGSIGKRLAVIIDWVTEGITSTAGISNTAVRNSRFITGKR